MYKVFHLEQVRMVAIVCFKDRPVPSSVSRRVCRDTERFINFLQVLTCASEVTFASQRLINYLCNGSV